MSKIPQINIGLFGYGTVGSRVHEILSRNQEMIRTKLGAGLQISKICIPNLQKKFSSAVPLNILTTKSADLLEDPEISIIVELIGNKPAALDVMKQALSKGNHLVTANKTLLAIHGAELLSLAAKHKVEILFEAAVGGSIPILRSLREGYVADKISSVHGIVNGTCNFILSEMSDKKREFADVLSEAQRLGYAEADPTADVEGQDAAYKLAILAMLAFNAPIDLKQIKLQGITQITKSDFDFAKEFGFTIKLFGVAKEHREKNNEGIELGVYPCLVPLRHPLANVSGANNAVYVKGDAVGETMFYGAGAGGLPTGSSIVGDVLQLIPNIHRGATTANLSKSLKPKKFLSPQMAKSGYFLRLTVVDTPGVLAKISSLFAKNKVSIQNTYQKTPQGKVAELVMILHPTQMRYFDKAISQIKKLAVVKKINAVIRIAEGL